MAPSSPSASGLQVPAGWALTQLTIHEQQADDSGGVPFAGTIMCQLRLDVGNASAQEVRATDLALFKRSYDGFRLVEQGELTIGASKIPQVTYTLVEGEHQQTLQQMVAYFQRNSDLYMLTATHRAGPGFERVRAQALELLSTLTAG